MREDYIEYLNVHNMPEYYNSTDYSDAELLIIIETHKYIKRRIDGQQFSDQMGARLVMSNFDDATKKLIDTYFTISQSYLCQGWWKSALRELIDKVPTAYVNAELLDEIRLSMSTYISASY